MALWLAVARGALRAIEPDLAPRHERVDRFIRAVWLATLRLTSILESCPLGAVSSGTARRGWLLGAIALMGVGACGGSDSADTATPAGAAAGSGGAAGGAGSGTAGTGGTTAGAAGASAGAAGGTGAPSQALIDACKERHTVACARMGECAPGALASFGGTEACVDHFAKLCVESSNAPGGAIGPAELAACTPKLASLSCGDYLRFRFGGEFDPCGYPRGSRADGEPCGIPSQCQGGACLSTSPTGCGTCGKLMKAGEPCSASAPCEGGYCGGGGVCVAFGKTGDVCSGSKPCQVDLLCTSGVCGPKHQLGEDCLPGQNNLSACGQGNHCNTVTKKCEAFTLVDVGAACGATEAGGWAVCKGASACKLEGMTGSCVPTVPKGADCAGTFWDNPCEPGTLCDQVCKVLNPGSCG